MRKNSFLSFTCVLSLLFLVSCASSKKTEDRKLTEREHENIKRDYQVIDSNSEVRPGWIEDAEIWAKGNEKDLDTFRYFSFETEPKVSREIACNLAQSNSRADIAAEISTFIEKRLGTSTEGQAALDENNPHVKALKEFTENTLAEKVQSFVRGASVIKSYWEKRAYKEDLGAKQDYTAYTCAVLVRFENKRLSKAIDLASDQVIKNTDDPATKENVKSALKNIDEEFIKARRGEI